MTLADDVADEVRDRLTDRRLSQNALARTAGIPPTMLHRALKGERRLTIDELDAVARALGETPEYLLLVARTRTPRSSGCSETNSEPRQE